MTNIAYFIARTIRQSFKDLLINTPLCEQVGGYSFQNTANLLEQARQFMRTHCERNEGKYSKKSVKSIFMMPSFEHSQAPCTLSASKALISTSARASSPQVAVDWHRTRWTLRWTVATTHSRTTQAAATTTTSRWPTNCVKPSTPFATASTMPPLDSATETTRCTSTPTSTIMAAIWRTLALPVRLQSLALDIPIRWVAQRVPTTLGAPIFPIQIRTTPTRTTQAPVILIQITPTPTTPTRTFPALAPIQAPILDPPTPDKTLSVVVICLLINRLATIPWAHVRMQLAHSLSSQNINSQYLFSPRRSVFWSLIEHTSCRCVHPSSAALWKRLYWTFGAEAAWCSSRSQQQWCTTKNLLVCPFSLLLFPTVSLTACISSLLFPQCHLLLPGLPQPSGAGALSGEHSHRGRSDHGRSKPRADDQLPRLHSWAVLRCDQSASLAAHRRFSHASSPLSLLTIFTQHIMCHKFILLHASQCTFLYDVSTILYSFFLSYTLLYTHHHTCSLPHTIHFSCERCLHTMTFFSKQPFVSSNTSPVADMTFAFNKPKTLVSQWGCLIYFCIILCICVCQQIFLDKANRP